MTEINPPACVIAAALLLGGVARGDGLPSAHEVLDKHIEALGGRAALEQLTSRVMKGSIDNSDDGSNTPVEIFAKSPARYAVVNTIPGYGVIATVWDGSVGWTKTPDLGVQAMNRSEAAAARRNYDFYRDLKLGELYSKLTVTGQDRVDDAPVYVVEAAPSEGSPEKLYFDVRTGLLLRRDFERITFEDGITPLEVYFEDYRDVDGVKVPFTVRQKAPDYTLTFKFTEVRHNVPVSDEAFVKPKK